MTQFWDRLSTRPTCASYLGQCRAARAARHRPSNAQLRSRLEVVSGLAAPGLHSAVIDTVLCDVILPGSLDGIGLAAASVRGAPVADLACKRRCEEPIKQFHEHGNTAMRLLRRRMLS